ncbi:haloacid dehalogenase [Stemphylium lycopersici]|uniref:Haloacid dehalogenase n=1 Tax=Stemphylium lycopersici TaxID=183478 RepID=A0A364N1U1_STELY|nr:haloacid dehalogenase [Stemphylium lycopersici]RAR03363.1 haloacid dehalogenase [Stemphylium lycopersici]RAR09729.1 haloacid dehalogenase [Stemphylium lycopersici]
MTKSASFDVIGTCFEFSAPVNAIQSRLGPKLKTAAVDPKTLFFSWFYAAQRDFTYVSMAGTYVPMAQVLKSTFRRACAVVDLPADAVSDADLEEVMTAFKSMGPREGLKACFDGLREVGWDVYGVTNGGSETSLNYYRNAGIDLDAEHLLSCDAIQIAKPDVRVYENADRHLTSRGAGRLDGERWFIAAHAWDLIAARKAGFKTAYLDFEEHDPCTDVFGKFDLYASSMHELLAKFRELK